VYRKEGRLACVRSASSQLQLLMAIYLPDRVIFTRFSELDHSIKIKWTGIKAIR
jgi:hypothetical protein